jgi:hypothetical protein
MDYIYVFAGMFVTIVALFNRNLLIEKRSFRVIFVISIMLFLAGLLLHLAQQSSDSSSGALLTPLLSLVLFRLCRRAFLRRYEKEPRDTWFNWARHMGTDRLFNIVYFASSIWLELLAIGGMMKLARIAW